MLLLIRDCLERARSFIRIRKSCRSSLEPRTFNRMHIRHV
jgi:hypothetical protein